MDTSIDLFQQQLLVGCLLGDANFQTNDGQSWRARFLHKAAHKSYIEHKFCKLRQYCNTGPKYSDCYDKRTNEAYKRYSFNTLYTTQLRHLGQLFYRSEKGIWKKHVPKNIKDYLTPISLAYWYMDDGALKWQGHSNAVRLCTDSFSEPEVNLLKDALEEKFNLECSLQKKNNISRISILESSYPTLRKLVLPNLEPCMFYKFPDGNKGVINNEDLSDDLRNRFIRRDIDLEEAT